MLEYEKVYHALGMPPAIIDIALGRIEIPIPGMVNPAERYSFPPALVPLISDGSGPWYWGLWKHWLTRRQASFVELDIEGQTALEYARTPEQLLCYLIISARIITDDITPAIRKFASKVGIQNLAEINAVMDKTGDRPHGFAALPQFRIDVPLESVKDLNTYTGDFPTGLFNGPRKWWLDACSFDVPEEAWAAWPDDIPYPRWLLPGDKPDLFVELMDAGDLHGAWLTLNSTGWSIDAAKSALADLAGTANDPQFDLLAEAWSAVADPELGDY